jgi:hypothetical protein
MDQLNNPLVVLNAPNIVCECGCKTFVQVCVLKKLSALVSPTGHQEVVEIPLYRCSECGKIPAEYMDHPNAKKIFGEDSDSNNEDVKPKFEI